MDPNVSLIRLREVCNVLHNVVTNSPRDDLDELVSEAIDLFIGLDEWLKRGGFLPADWVR